MKTPTPRQLNNHRTGRLLLWPICCIGIVLLLLVPGQFAATNAQTKSDAKPAPARKTPKPQTREDDAKQHPLRAFMYVKLVQTNQILAGLVTEDFRLIRHGADELTKMSKLEKWRVSNDVMYRQETQDFQSQVARLQKAAADKNLDRATLAYLEVTMSCISCHKWVRAKLIADVDQLPTFQVPDTRVSKD